MERPLNVLLFGGCLLHQPIQRSPAARAKLSFQKYGPLTGVHSFGEMFQVISVLRGEKSVPLELRPLCRMSPGLRPIARSKDFGDLDIALVEPASPIEIIFRGVNINRNAIMQHVVAPIRELSREAGKCATKWFRLGLMALNEDVQTTTARELLEYVRRDMKNADLIRSVINEVRSSKADVLDGLRKMRELLGCPIGVVVYIFQYLPDGRALSWPAGFHEEVTAAAWQLELPLLEPASLVRTFGVEAALDKDLRHYSHEFMPVAADALVSFAESVASQSTA